MSPYVLWHAHASLSFPCSLMKQHIFHWWFADSWLSGEGIRDKKHAIVKKKLSNIKIKSSKYCLLREMRIKTSIKKINKILITSTWSFNKHKRIPTFHRKSLLFKPDRRCVNKQTQCPGNIVYKRWHFWPDKNLTILK